MEGSPEDPADRPTEEVVRDEERLHVDPVWRGVGSVEARREVETENVRLSVPREVERVTHERVPAHENDSGQIETLPDGTVSIPLYEEEVVVTKRIVLRERVLIRKQTVTKHEDVREQVRRERVSIDADKVPHGSVLGAEGMLGGGRGLRGRAVPGGPVETRPFFLTSEFLALLAAAAGIAITAAVSKRLDAGLAWPLIAGLVSLYMLGRGFAKRGGDW